MTDKNKNTNVFKQQDYDKMKQNLTNLEKANKVSIRFSINYFTKFCVDNGNDNSTYCNYFMIAQGHQIVNKIIEKFYDSESSLQQLLALLDSSLKSLNDRETAYQISENDFISKLIKIIKTKQFQSCVDLSYDIITKTVYFENTHENCMKQGTLEFLKEKLDTIKSTSNQSPENLLEIAKLFNLVKFLSRNQDTLKKIQEQKIFSSVIEIYLQNEDIDFLKDILIEILEEMSDNQQNVEIVKNSKLDFQNLLQKTVLSRNQENNKKMQKIIKNFADENEIKTIIDQAKQGSTKAILHLGFLSSQEIYLDLLEEQSLRDYLMQRLNSNGCSEIEKFAIIKLMSQLVQYDNKYLQYFDQKKGIDTIIASIENPTSDSYFYLTQTLNFFNTMLDLNDENFKKKIKEKQIAKKFYKYFIDFQPTYEQFKRLNLNNKIALQSIQYNKSEASKKLLLAQQNINERQIVSEKDALNYLSFKSLSIELVKFIGKIEQTQSEVLDLEEDYFKTILLLLKVFKNEKQVYNIVFESLSQFEYNKKQGEIIYKLNYMSFLCDKIWLKPEWNIFSLYCARFMEKLTNQNEIISILKNGVNAIKLVASIKNFINEEEYKVFEYHEEDEEEIDDNFEKLTFSQEREIHKKCAQILEKLLDSTTLLTFKHNIEKTISNFKTQKETIMILRAEYGVLACVNGINIFGVEGLRDNMHQWLKKNIEQIEQKCKNQDFQNKEKLLADCIKAISNFICITWNRQGRDMYQKKEVSVIVFDLLEKYLKESKYPLRSYVMLRVFKDWLIERIEIIEQATNLERLKIYDENSFMIVPMEKQDQIIVNVLDALYSTNQKFASSEKLIQLNFEVIMLLSYVYPNWSSRVAKNFIPQILEILDTQNFSLEADGQAIDLLKNLTGCDERTAQPNQALLDIAAQKNALQIIAKSISNHNYDQDYIDKCKDLLNNLGQNEKNLESCYDAIDDLIQKLESKQNSDLNDPEEIDELTRINNQLNAFCIVDPLRLYAFENGHPKVINKIWNKVQNKILQNPENLAKLEKLENCCALTMAQHLKGIKDEESLNEIYGNQNDNEKDDNNLVLNALRSIQLNKKDPKLVQLNSQIVNKCFPGHHEKSIKSLAKKLNFQPDLDYVFNKHGKSNDSDIAQEVTNLYVNLSLNKNDDMIERILKKNARQLKQDLNQENLSGVIKDWATLKPYLEDPVFIKNYEELEIEDCILKTLKLLQKNTQEKTNKNLEEIMQEILGNDQIPDLGINNRKKLKDEIKLAKNVTQLMLNLPEKANKKMINNPQIVELSNIAAILNGSPQTFKLFENFLENPDNKNIMYRNKSLECGTYLLMKNNKDTFKPEELGNQVDLTVSTLHSVIKSIQPQNDLSTSKIYTQKANDKNQKIIQQNLDDFGRMADQVLQPQQIDDIFKKYVAAMKGYKKDNQNSQQKLLQTSRLVSALLAGCPGSVELQKYGESLLEGFQALLNHLREEKVPNKKIMKFTENNMNSIGFILDGTGIDFKNPLLWNLLIERYFIISPGLIRSNPQTIFANLELTRPFDDSSSEYQFKFQESNGGLSLRGNLDRNGLLMSTNAKSSKDIVLNFYYGITKNPIPEEIALNNLQALCKSSKFCKAFLNTKHFMEFFNRLKDSKLLPDDKFFKKNCEIFKNVVISVAQDQQKNKNKYLEIFRQLSSEDLMLPFIEIIEDKNMNLIPNALEVLLVMYDICSSRQIYYDRKFPLALYKLIGNQQLKDNQSNLLLCKILSDSSLENIFKQMNLFEESKKVVKDQIYPQNQGIKNPSQFSEFQRETNLPENQKKLNLVLQAYTFGELSRTSYNAQDLANPKNNLMDVFDLYNQFEKFGNLPIVAVKTLEAVKNGVYNLSEETLQNKEEKINKIVKQIPRQIEKYEKFNRTQNLLKDILDFFKNYLLNRKPKTEIERFLEHLASNQKQSGKDRIKDSQQIATLYDELLQELMKKPFNNDQIRVYEILNNEVNELLDQKNQDAYFPLFNLKVTENLRLIANNPNSSFDEKYSALLILNKFAQNPEILSKMLNESFYVDKSSELIDSILKGAKTVQEIEKDQQPTLEEDLIFMKNLTSQKEGVDHVMKKGDANSNLLIKNLFDILLSNSDNQKIKREALQILKNLLNFSDDKNLENLILNNLPKLLNKCSDEFDLISNLIDLTNVLACKNDDNKSKLVEKNILEPTSHLLYTFKNKGNSLNTAVAKLVNNLCNNKPQNLDYVMKSGVIEALSDPFKNVNSDKDFHQVMGKNMLQLSFQNPDRKSKLVQYGYIKGLVPLFKHYSSPEHFDENMISLVLKCMANFSLVTHGIETLLNDGVIPAFQEFFNNHKEDLNDQNLLLFCTLSNLSYENNEKFLNKILQDNGLDLVLQALDYYNKTENEPNCEAAIDSLTHLAGTQKTVDLLKDKKLHSIDILVDTIRQQLSSPLVYKSLRCLTKFCEYDSLSDRFMNKNGSNSAMDLIKPYKKDLKNVYQTLKLMSVLIHKYPDRLEDFLIAGIPEKIIDEFDMEWPIEIIKKIIELFARMVRNDHVKDQIAENFLTDLIKIMNDFFKNKQVVRNGVVLLALCSDNIQTVESVQKAKGNDLICKILKKYLSSEDIVYNDLILMENMIRMHQDTKQEYLDQKVDQVVENIVETCDPKKQKKLLHQSKRVLELLRGKIHQSIQESLDVETLKEMENQQDQVVPQENDMKFEISTVENKSFADLIPANIKKFLKNGRIMRVYGEDSVCRSMHFFLSKDMQDIKCKHPKENFIKQKWIIPIHQIKEIKYKYDKKSPIAKSANFFRKAPAPERCFAIYGPIVYGGQRNFHVVCENSLEAKQWYDYLIYLLNEYKQAKKRNLNLNNA